MNSKLIAFLSAATLSVSALAQTTGAPIPPTPAPAGQPGSVPTGSQPTTVTPNPALNTSPDRGLGNTQSNTLPLEQPRSTLSNNNNLSRTNPNTPNNTLNNNNNNNNNLNNNRNNSVNCASTAGVTRRDTTSTSAMTAPNIAQAPRLDCDNTRQVRP